MYSQKDLFSRMALEWHLGIDFLEYSNSSKCFSCSVPWPRYTFVQTVYENSVIYGGHLISFWGTGVLVTVVSDQILLT